MEAEYVEPVAQITPPQPVALLTALCQSTLDALVTTVAAVRSTTTEWCAFPLATDASLCVGRALADGVGLIIDETPAPVNPVTKPLVEAAKRKEKELKFKIPQVADCITNGREEHNGKFTPPIACAADYVRTQEIYNARWDAPADDKLRLALNAEHMAAIRASRPQPVTA